MHGFTTAVAVLAGVGIIAIGLAYLAAPRAATQSFGLPLPEAGANVAWWLRLKGVRDVTAGLIALAALRWGGPTVLGAALLIEALIPLGDMTMVLAARGVLWRALAIHGLTAALMIAAAALLLSGHG